MLGVNEAVKVHDRRHRAGLSRDRDADTWFAQHVQQTADSRRVEDIKGLKVRVQATATEDLMFPVYGAQTVHMPFGSVYTSLQTGVVDVAENSVNVYLANKHYEVAPVLSMTEHEANNNLLWVSDKLIKKPERGAKKVGSGRRG